MREQKTCKQRIGEQLQSRLDELIPNVDEWDIAKCKAYLDDIGVDLDEIDGLDAWRDTVREIMDERRCDDILSIEKVITYRVCLSWGGPADYFEFDFNNNGDMVEGRYLFQDWFDGARRRLDDATAEQLVDYFAVGPDFE